MATGQAPEASRPAAGVAWRPPIGHGWRLELAVAGLRDLPMSAGRASTSLDATWLQLGIVTPPATRGVASARAFLRAGATAIEQCWTDYSAWAGRLEWAEGATMASAALGVRLDLAVSRRLALGLHVAFLGHASSDRVDTPGLITAGLGLTARL